MDEVKAPETLVVYWPDCDEVNYDYVPLFAHFRDAVAWARVQAKQIQKEDVPAYVQTRLYVDRWEFPLHLEPKGPTDWYSPVRGYWVDVQSLEEGFNVALNEWD
jgi:hypothetical protein